MGSASPPRGRGAHRRGERAARWCNCANGEAAARADTCTAVPGRTPSAPPDDSFATVAIAVKRAARAADRSSQRWTIHGIWIHACRSHRVLGAAGLPEYARISTLMRMPSLFTCCNGASGLTEQPLLHGLSPSQCARPKPAARRRGVRRARFGRCRRRQPVVHDCSEPRLARRSPARRTVAGLSRP